MSCGREEEKGGKKGEMSWDVKNVLRRVKNQLQDLGKYGNISNENKIVNNLQMSLQKKGV